MSGFFKNRVGMTGTQAGMTQAQQASFVYQIIALKPKEFHHGDCIGADEEAHYLVREHVPDCVIVIHPPLLGTKRAWCQGDVILPAKEYIERNHDIVQAVSVMVATPEQVEEQLRSGTWATVRYARKCRRDVRIIQPDGTLPPLN